MPRPIHCILLIDDDPDDNFLHQLTIDESGLCDEIRVVESARQAIDYLSQPGSPAYLRPSLMLLDVNMPGMNGYEFMEAYNQLPRSLSAGISVFMLTTSFGPADRQRISRMANVRGLYAKPLTQSMIEEMVAKHVASMH